MISQKKCHFRKVTKYRKYLIMSGYIVFFFDEGKVFIGQSFLKKIAVFFNYLINTLCSGLKI